MKKTKRGFTLVELIVTIVLLGVVGAIIVYNMTSVATTNKETDYERFVAAIKSAASVYADANQEVFNQLYVDKAFIYFTVGDLVNDGLLDENLRNPYTEKKVDKSERIKANLDTDSGAVVFEYPVEGNEEESFLVALSDYVVYGETYNCMQGAGTYKLSLSDEEGNLIMLNSQANIKKYNFTCELPSNFDPTNPGNYDVVYNWVTESGTRKSATRVLKVLAKITPDFAITESITGASFDYNKSTKFTPTIDSSCTNWNILTYKPIISGADVSNTTYKISQQSIYPKTGAIQVITDYTNDYTKVFYMENGYYKYIVETRVYGHYDLDYFYDGKTEIKVLQELVVPACKVTGSSTSWAIERNYSISDTYADNVVRYQYAVVNDGTIKDTEYKARRESDYKSFNRTGATTTKKLNVNENGCGVKETTYTKVYFRAVDSNGYIGSWTPAFNAYLTNSLTNLVTVDKGSNCANQCTPTSSLGLNASFGSNTSLHNLDCYYCNKDIYFKMDNQMFNVIGLFNNVGPTHEPKTVKTGYLYDSSMHSYSRKAYDYSIPNNDLLVATDSVISNELVSLSALTPDTWTIQTCDGLYSTGFQYNAPAFNIATDKVSEWIDDYYDRYKQAGNLVMHNWRADIGKIDTDKLPKFGQYINSTNHATPAQIQATWNEWANALTKSETIYSSYAGLPTLEQYSAIFKNAIYTPNAEEYWLASTFSNKQFNISVAHGDNTNVRDTHFYVAKNGVASDDVAVNSQACDPSLYDHPSKVPSRCFRSQYVGAKAYIKAMMRVRNLVICSGAGTAANPYVVFNNVLK